MRLKRWRRYRELYLQAADLADALHTDWHQIRLAQVPQQTFSADVDAARTSAISLATHLARVLVLAAPDVARLTPDDIEACYVDGRPASAWRLRRRATATRTRESENRSESACKAPAHLTSQAHASADDDKSSDDKRLGAGDSARV